jgi:hypothetical protein
VSKTNRFCIICNLNKLPRAVACACAFICVWGGFLADKVGCTSRFETKESDRDAKFVGAH